MSTALLRAVRYHLLIAGYWGNSCPDGQACPLHRRAYFIVIYGLGADGETSYKMGMN